MQCLESRKDQLFCCFVGMRSRFTVPYITISFFSIAIPGFYLHSDLANYSVAYLSKALIFLQVCENTVLLLIACNTQGESACVKR